MVNGVRSDAITVPAADFTMRFWRNTNIANNPTLPTGTLGYEWDSDLDNGFRPAGLMDLSSTTLNVSPDLLLDYGSTYGSGTATHSLTLYRASSGALVFGAGTTQWSWGLDSHHDRGSAAPRVSMEQATVNLFADMVNIAHPEGVQPGTLQTGLGLVAATASTDHTPPTSTITSPTAGTNVQSGTPVTITGTALDAGGGVVGGVEVSVDGGTTWHPATLAAGRGSWSYTWTPGGSSGQVTIKSRAVDDSGNIETPAAGVMVMVQGGQNNPSGTSIFSATATPKTSDAGADSPLEVGVKFRSDVNGFITGIRFYKSSNNTGTHIGDLWDSAGNLLKSATFTGETASGWQQVTFATPVAILANTVYVASYHTTDGHYAEDDNYFTSGVDSGTMHAPADGGERPNGVYAYGSTSTFPNTGYQASNYWVDVAFTAATTATHLTVAAPASATAGTPFNVTVTALNASNGPAADYTGTVHFTSSDGQAVLPANYTFTAGDAGVHTFHQRRHPQDGRQPDGHRHRHGHRHDRRHTGTVAVSPAAASALAVTAPASATAGDPFSVTVTAKDPYSNTATGYPARSNSPAPTVRRRDCPPTSYTFTSNDAGVHTFTRRDPEDRRQPDGHRHRHGHLLPITGSATVAVTSATAATHLAVAAPHLAATAGGTFSVTVTALNASNGPATGYLGTVQFTSTDAQAVLPANYTFTAADAGVHTFSAPTSQQRRHPQDGRQPDGHRHRHGHRHDHRHRHRRGQPSGGQRPGGGRVPLAGRRRHRGQLHRHRQGPLQQHRHRLHRHGPLHQQRAPAVLPADATLTGGDRGTFSATLKTVGTQSLTATDTAPASTITGTQAGITVTAPNYTIWSPTDVPGTPFVSDSAIEVGVKFRSDVAGTYHRHPLLQGHRQHRHPHRPPLDQHRRHPAGHRHLYRRDPLGLADGQLLQPGGDHRRHRLRRLVPQHQGLRRGRQLLQHPPQQRASDCSSRRDERPQRRLQVRCQPLPQHRLPED